MSTGDDEIWDSLTMRTTGVPNTIFVSACALPPPRIKIAIDPPNSLNATAGAAAMAIDDFSTSGGPVPPHLAGMAADWIRLNREALLDYWNCRIATADLLRRLRPVS